MWFGGGMKSKTSETAQVLYTTDELTTEVTPPPPCHHIESPRGDCGTSALDRREAQMGYCLSFSRAFPTVQ